MFINCRCHIHEFIAIIISRIKIYHITLINSKKKYTRNVYVTHIVLHMFQAIYQLFYNTKSAKESGTLFHLRNIVNRRNVSGADGVREAFRYYNEIG